MNNPHIAIHHIGARGGTYFLSGLKQFIPDFKIFLYDADADMCDTMPYTESVHILPYCVGAEIGKAQFNLAYDLANSSLFAFNSEYADWYLEDYIDKPFDAMQSAQTLEVSIATIDDVLKKAPAQSPDFLSIDAEGASFEIIQGAAKAIQDTVVCLVCEVEFFPVRQGQKTFPDVLRALEKDFYFSGFVNTPVEASPFRAPIGLRGKGFPLLGDALFLRKKEQAPDLLKLAFAAFANGFVEYGFYCLHDMDVAARLDGGKQHYLNFIKALQTVFVNADPVYKVSFKDLNPTFEESRTRYDRLATPQGFQNKKTAMERLSIKMDRQICTDIEQIYYTYGMPHIAEIIKARRGKKYYYI